MIKIAMRRALTIAGVVALTGVAPRSVWAQGAVAAVGDTVRVFAPEDAVWRGRLTALTHDSLTLALADSSHTLARADVLRLERYEGREHKLKTGAGIGFLLGALLGGAVGYTGISDDGTSTSDRSPARAAGAGIGIGLLGAAVGGIIGAGVVGDHWEPAHLATP